MTKVDYPKKRVPFKYDGHRCKILIMPEGSTRARECDKTLSQDGVCSYSTHHILQREYINKFVVDENRISSRYYNISFSFHNEEIAKSVFNYYKLCE